LHASSIKKVNIEVEGDIQLGEALRNAIVYYNSNNKNNQIVDEESYYKIMLSDEEGLPEEDLPCTFQLI